jgi:leader peptidase (prepilin peptidase) / N-methyltransferase
MIAGPILEPFLVLSGVVVGSFCANTALRTQRGEQALVGPSRCDACRAELSFVQSAPVISFVMLKGGCAACGARIDPAHPIGEIGGGLIVLGALQAGTPVSAALVALIGFTLLTTSIIDLKSQRLPDAWTLLVAILAGLLAVLGPPAAAIEGLASALLVFGVLEVVRRGYQKLRGRSGLGFGDVKLLSALALWLGLSTPWAVVLASVLGMAAFVIARPRDNRIAFGPAIALAAWLIGTLREAGHWPI